MPKFLRAVSLLSADAKISEMNQHNYNNILFCSLFWELQSILSELCWFRAFVKNVVGRDHLRCYAGFMSQSSSRIQ